MTYAPEFACEACRLHGLGEVLIRDLRFRRGAALGAGRESRLKRLALGVESMDVVQELVVRLGGFRNPAGAAVGRCYVAAITLLRPADFASYMARSARLMTWSTVSPGSTKATPTLTLPRSSRSISG